MASQLSTFSVLFGAVTGNGKNHLKRADKFVDMCCDAMNAKEMFFHFPFASSVLIIINKTKRSTQNVWMKRNTLAVRKVNFCCVMIFLYEIIEQS